jgi:hypothetical protein
VALIDCVFCVGRSSFLDGRLNAFKRMVRKLFPSIRDPLNLPDGENYRRGP